MAACLHAGVTGSVRATPAVAPPNSWVKLECSFDIPSHNSSVVRWLDANYDTLYTYRKARKPHLRFGASYFSASNRENSRMKDVRVERRTQSLMVFVTDCNPSPYTCYASNATATLQMPLYVDLECK